ncbi:MAG: hypothetical protein LQ338_003385 [Usnochroma carphineum]|nr:MAG: hypothetical protein LQ338_003385 [Usnochroma carphineum]
MNFPPAFTTPGVEAISDYLDRQDFYRHGHPHKPLPRPHNDRPLRGDHALCNLVDDLHGQINDLLHAHGVDSVQAAVASSQWRFEEDETEPRQTVTLYTHPDQSDPTNWPDLVKAVATIFQARGFPNTQVEILNPDKTYYAPVLSEQAVPAEIRNHFSDVHNRLILTAKEFINDGWLSVELRMCKRELEAPVATTVLYVEEDTTCVWDQLLEALKEKTMGEVPVRLQPAQLRPARGPLFPLTPGNGGSISAADKPNRYGTIGVHVNVIVPKEISCPSGLSVGNNNCVLTCHHVVAPACTEQIWEKANHEGIQASPDHDDRTKQMISYPGRGLLESTYSQHQQSLARVRAALDKVNDQPEPISAHQQDIIKCQKAAIKELQAGMEECVNLLSESRYQLGTVVASSGHKVDSQGFLQDVGVVSIAPTFASLNLVPVHDNSLWRHIKGRHIACLEEPQCGDQVFKEGAKTGVTEGFIIRREHITVKSVCPVNKNITKRIETEAWSVTGSDFARSTGNSAFAAKGDSGALVANTSCAWVGQIHSRLDAGQGAVTAYMSPATNVLETARALLPGCQVELLTELPSIPAVTRLLNRCRHLVENLI